jgi:hypothetical protein
MRYFMRSTYMHEGKEHSQVGILLIGEPSVMAGRISGHSMEPDSSWPQEKVDGSFARGKEGVEIEFQKVSPDTLTRYFLRKTDGKHPIEGTYEGHWTFVDEEGVYHGRDQARMTLDARV